MTAVERLLDTARGEIGVTEYPPGSNKVKYNTWFYGREASGSGYPWCCAFVCWVFHRAGLSGLVRRTGGCTTMMNWFKAKGRLAPVREARPGDLVFYQFDKDAYADHIGIVERADKTGLTAIEGNTSMTSDDNGGAVMRRRRGWSAVMAVARPDYESGERKDEVDMTKEEVTKLVDEAAERAANRLAPKVFVRTGDVPEYWREEIAALERAGALRGDGTGAVNLTETEAKVLAVVARLYKGGERA